jgi:hypothetical protein
MALLQMLQKDIHLHLKRSRVTIVVMKVGAGPWPEQVTRSRILFTWSCCWKQEHVTKKFQVNVAGPVVLASEPATGRPARSLTIFKSTMQSIGYTPFPPDAIQSPCAAGPSTWCDV